MGIHCAHVSTRLPFKVSLSHMAITVDSISVGYCDDMIDSVLNGTFGFLFIVNHRDTNPAIIDKREEILFAVVVPVQVSITVDGFFEDLNMFATSIGMVFWSAVSHELPYTNQCIRYLHNEHRMGTAMRLAAMLKTRKLPMSQVVDRVA